MRIRQHAGKFVKLKFFEIIYVFLENVAIENAAGRHLEIHKCLRFYPSKKLTFVFIYFLFGTSTLMRYLRRHLSRAKF